MSRWTLDMDLPDSEVGEIYHSPRIELSGDYLIELSALYRVTASPGNGRYTCKMLVVAFDTERDYQRFAESRPGIPGEEPPRVYIADRDRLWLLSEEGLETGSIVPVSICKKIGNERRVTTVDCLIEDSGEMVDGCHKVFVDPVDKVFKRQALVATHAHCKLEIDESILVSD